MNTTTESNLIERIEKLSIETKLAVKQLKTIKAAKEAQGAIRREQQPGEL